VASVLEQ